MTSELRVDNLKGSTTGGSISVLGEGTSATTNLQQGLCKCWADFNGSGTAALTDSFNSGSFTDNGTGDYTVAYTSNMASGNYVFTGCNVYEGGTSGNIFTLTPKYGSADNRGASSVRMASVYDTQSTISHYDYEQQQFQVVGDLA